MEKIKIDCCPYCKSEDLAEGYSNDIHTFETQYGFKQTKVLNLVCKKCGSVIHSRIEDDTMFECPQPQA